MAGGEGSTFDKAESFARRVLERLGAEADKKLGLENQHILTQGQISDIISRLELAIESNLKEDTSGRHRVAPNRFQVLFTYESGLTLAYTCALGKELQAAVFEYICNRRYETIGEVSVGAGVDVFAKSVQIKPSFVEGDRALDQPASSLTSAHESVPRATSGCASRMVTIQGPGSSSHQVKLEAGGAVSIGRSAENTLRIDDHSISRLHCSLALRSSGDVVVSDLGSSNGTSVNGERLAAAEARSLTQGDLIRVGDVEISVTAID